MKRAWVGIALLAGSWLFGLGYYHHPRAAEWVTGAILVAAGTALLSGVAGQGGRAQERGGAEAGLQEEAGEMPVPQKDMGRTAPPAGRMPASQRDTGAPPMPPAGKMPASQKDMGGMAMAPAGRMPAPQRRVAGACSEGALAAVPAGKSTTPRSASCSKS